MKYFYFFMYRGKVLKVERPVVHRLSTIETQDAIIDSVTKKEYWLQEHNIIVWPDVRFHFLYLSRYKSPRKFRKQFLFNI